MDVGVTPGTMIEVTTGMTIDDTDTLRLVFTELSPLVLEYDTHEEPAASAETSREGEAADSARMERARDERTKARKSGRQSRRRRELVAGLERALVVSILAQHGLLSCASVGKFRSEPFFVQSRMMQSCMRNGYQRISSLPRVLLGRKMEAKNGILHVTRGRKKNSGIVVFLLLNFWGVIFDYG